MHFAEPPLLQSRQETEIPLLLRLRTTLPWGTVIDRKRDQALVRQEWRVPRRWLLFWCRAFSLGMCRVSFLPSLRQREVNSSKQQEQRAVFCMTQARAEMAKESAQTAGRFHLSLVDMLPVVTSLEFGRSGLNLAISSIKRLGRSGDALAPQNDDHERLIASAYNTSLCASPV